MVSLDKSHPGREDREKFITQGLIIDTLRGDDSTGIFHAHRRMPQGGNPGYAKQAVDGYRFVHSDMFIKKIKELRDDWFVVGHNRAATVGGISASTAHPFTEGAITMVHNGTLRGNGGLAVTQQQLGVQVDSHALCHNLDLVGPEEVGEVISDIQGAFALVWYDSRDMSLNIVRNSERPLHIAKERTKDTVYFASEAAQLSWLDKRIKIGMGDIYQPSPGVHLKFTVDSIQPRVSEVSLAKKYTTTTRSTTTTTKSGTTADPSTGSPARRSVSGLLPPPNTVSVGGRRQPLPDGIQAQLLNEKISEQDLFHMTPMQKLPARGNKPQDCIVTGHIAKLDMAAVLVNVGDVACEANFKKRWVVRPRAVRYSHDGQPILMASLLSYSDESFPEYWAWKDTGPGNTREEASGDEDAPFLGPQGGKVTEERWLQIVGDGCTYCTAPIVPEERSEVSWYDDLWILCPECTAGVEEHG